MSKNERLSRSVRTGTYFLRRGLIYNDHRLLRGQVEMPVFWLESIIVSFDLACQYVNPPVEMDIILATMY